MVTKAKTTKSPSNKGTSKAKKTTSPGGTAGGTRGDDGYIRLRTMIDSLECGSIRYYLEGATPETVLDVPQDFVPKIVGSQLVRVRSQTVYYILTRMKSVCKVWLNRERAAS